MNINNISCSTVAALFLHCAFVCATSPARGHSDVFLSNVGGSVAIGGANELGHGRGEF